jgi:hypothetical protein
MARIESLSILLDPSGEDFLAEEYGKVIENIEKTTISYALKNTDLSGTPTSGTVEAKRFVNAASKDYGTARAANKADQVKAKPVTVAIDKDKEIIEEIEQKDVSLYGVDSVVSRRVANHGKTMTRDLERAFFEAANTEGTAFSGSASAINEKVEEVIQQIESTKNDYVDGVDRDMISVICTPKIYGQLRNFLDTDTNNANIDTGMADFGTFHGVRIYSSVYLPSGVDMIGMVDGAVAQPVLPTVANPTKIQLSNAIGFGIFYSYGTKAVMPDLIVKVTTG